MKYNGVELNKDLLDIYGLTEKEAYEVFEFVDKVTRETDNRLEGLKRIMKELKGNKRLLAIGYYEFRWGYLVAQDIALANIIAGIVTKEGWS